MLEAGLRIVVGGVASDAARAEQPTVRALLESAPAPATVPPTPQTIRRAPVLGTLRADLPELAIWTVGADARSGRSPASVRRRLKALGGRVSAAEAEGTRPEATPWAYRVLLRQLGADPADPRSVTEELALHPAEGADLDSAGLPADALLVAPSRPASRCSPSTPIASMASSPSGVPAPVNCSAATDRRFPRAGW